LFLVAFCFDVGGPGWRKEVPMVTVLDVAAYILEKQGEMTAMKLQKLVYYCQAWSLVWDEQPLFHERVEAWANGPVVRELYDAHRGRYSVTHGSIRGNPSTLDLEQRDTVNAVLEYYGDKSSQWLSDLTHAEAPWKDARAGLSPGERGSSEITIAQMAEYYGSL
jgi:uncharacterized phage-associated protein